MFIEDTLADIGCEIVATATNLTEAMTKVTEIECDVIMLDVNLSGTQTFKFAESLCERHLPFIFSTGYGIAGIPPHLHHVPVLQKPFQESDLREMLHDVLNAERT